MSLTSHLDDRASPVHQFFAERVPLAASRTAVRVLNTEARASMPWGGPMVVADTVPTLAGSAFDFGFRHWVSPFGPNHQPRVAVSGARVAAAHGWPAAPALVEAIIEALPTREPLEQTRCFVALAAVERFRRVRSIVLPDAKEPRDAGDVQARQLLADPPLTLAALLARVPDATAQDVAALLAMVVSRWGVLQGQPFVPNPNFALSGALGGADADWVLGHVLYECKVSYLTNPVERRHLLQLLGYLLADSDDALGVEAVCLMLPRHYALVRVGIPRFLRLLGLHKELPALRESFAAVVTALPPRNRRVR